jgi:hypothetical protein
VGSAISATIIGTILQITGSYFLIFAMASSTYIVVWIIIELMIPKIQPLEFEINLEI